MDGGGLSDAERGVAELFEGVGGALFGGAVFVGGVGTAEGVYSSADGLCRGAVGESGEGDSAVFGVGHPKAALAVLVPLLLVELCGGMVCEVVAHLPAEGDRIAGAGELQQCTFGVGA